MLQGWSHVLRSQILLLCNSIHHMSRFAERSRTSWQKKCVFNSSHCELELRLDFRRSLVQRLVIEPSSSLGRLCLLLIQITVRDQTVNMQSCYVLEKHSRIRWCKVTNWVAASILNAGTAWTMAWVQALVFCAPPLGSCPPLESDSRFTLAPLSSRFRLCSPKIRKKIRLFGKLIVQ